jgi:hypothetical protein
MVVTGLGLLAFGAVQAFQPEPVPIIPSVVELGDLPVGEGTTTLTIENPTSEPFRVLGARICCGLEAVDPLPLTVPPYESRELTLRFRCIGEPGAERKMLYDLFVERDDDMTFRGELRYRIAQE